MIKKFLIIIFLFNFFSVKLFSQINSGWDKPVMVTSKGASFIKANLSKEGTVIGWISNEKLTINTPDENKIQFSFPSGFEPEFDFVMLPDNSIRGLIVISSNLYRFRFNKLTKTKETETIRQDFCHSPKIFQGNDRIIETFTRLTNNKYRIFINICSNKLSDNGKEFTILPSTDEEYIGTFFPQFIILDECICCIFINRTSKEVLREDSVWFTSSMDGKTWKKPIRLSPNKGNAEYPSIFSPDKKEIIITFGHKDNFGVYRQYLLNSKDLGQTFNTTVATDFLFPLNKTHLAKIEDSILLIGYDRYFENRGSLLIRSWSEKEGFGNISRISGTTNDVWALSVANSSNRVFIAWLENKGRLMLTGNDIYAATPLVFSHDIFTNYESSCKTPLIEWEVPEDSSGYTGFAWLLDRIPYSEPDIINLDGSERSFTLKYLFDGEWFFHIRSIDGKKNWSKTSHFKFKINTDALDTPIITSPTHPEFEGVLNDNPVFTWKMPENNKRKIAGYSTILTKDNLIQPPEHIQTTKESISFTAVPAGIWHFRVKACDIHSNWSDYANYTINIEGPAEEKITYPIQESSDNDFIYTVKKGEALSIIIKKVLGLKKDDSFKSYLKEIAKYNKIADVDNIKPNDRIHFPAIIASEDTDIATLAQKILGNVRFKNNLTLPGKPNIDSVKKGDTVIIRDISFFKKWSENKISNNKTNSDENLIETVY